MQIPSYFLIAARLYPLLAQAQAQAQGSASNFINAISYIIYILMVVGFVWGIIKCIGGFAGMRGGGGMDSMMEIVGGVGIALAPWIMYLVFNNILGGSIAPNPNSIKALPPGQ
jgi:H+/Cl- antiporter ClcA